MRTLIRVILPIDTFHLHTRHLFPTRRHLRSARADGERECGDGESYQPTFSNTTWQEFVYADGFALAGRYREAAAVLYRPQRTPYDGETDRRIPFSIYGTDTRLALFDAVPEEVLLAVILNYNALRKIHLEAKYPHVFARGSRSSGGGGAFSWVRIHRDLMGDQFFDEKKFFESNVHVILHRLNHIIEDSQSRH